jgi:hypothetical protein
VEEVKKSVNPIVYKSASVRNLPVPVQSVLQLLSTMDTEGSPFESEEEVAYNKLLGEMAKQKLECAAKIEELQRVILQRSACTDEGGTEAGEGGSGDSEEIFNEDSAGSGGGVGSNHSVGHFVNSSTHAGNPGNVTTTSLGDLVNHTLSHNHTSPPSVVNGSSVFNSTANGSFVRDGCPPCPILHEGGGPSSCDSDTHVAALATPEAVLVGAAAAVLVLVVAAAVAIVVRYLPTITSGLLIVATIVLEWYLSSMYPEAARRLGARLLGALRRAATSIVDRVLRRHHPEVKSSCVN